MCIEEWKKRDVMCAVKETLRSHMEDIDAMDGWMDGWKIKDFKLGEQFLFPITNRPILVHFVP